MDEYKSVDLDDQETTYTDQELFGIYRSRVDREEYPTYSCWLWDMVRSGILVKIESEEE